MPWAKTGAQKSRFGGGSEFNSVHLEFLRNLKYPSGCEASEYFVMPEGTLLEWICVSKQEIIWLVCNWEEANPGNTDLEVISIGVML